MKKEMNNKGFSLVELIIVIAIMVILVAVLAPQYLRYVEKSRVSTDTQTCVEFINALQVLASDPDAATYIGGATSFTISSNSNGEIDASDVENVLGPSGLAVLDDAAINNSKFQSTAFKAAQPKLELNYDSTNRIWVLTCTGVDNSGNLTSGAGGGAGGGSGSGS